MCVVIVCGNGGLDKAKEGVKDHPKLALSASIKSAEEKASDEYQFTLQTA